MRNRIQLLTYVFIFTLSLSSLSFVLSDDRPNIVLILADDMGYGDIQAYNKASKIPTPHLNSLARDGMLFTDAHSPSAVCTPTRYALLTGRYCWRSKLKRGVLGGYSKPLIEKGRSTMADLLKKKGYNTGMVGKWHLGMDLPLLPKSDKKKLTKWQGDPGIDFKGTITDGPTHHGFDYFFGISASLDMAPYVYIRNDRFTQLPTEQQKAIPFPYFIRTGPKAKDFIVEEVLDRLTDEATEFIKSRSKKDEPYFLYMPLTAPHKPTQPHPRFKGKTQLGEYGDFVLQVDDSVGRVLKAIEESGERDKTLVIYSSDNGSYMYRISDDSKSDHVTNRKEQKYKASSHLANGVLRGTKADVWEAGHRVPFLVRWPEKIKKGSQSKVTVCLTDLYATFAEINKLKLSSTEAEDSFSLLENFKGNETDRGAPVVNHSISGMFAIREGKWKLVLGTGSGGREHPRGKPFQKPYKLFDLDKDLEEKNDVASENPTVVERLSIKMDAIRRSGRSVNR